MRRFARISVLASTAALAGAVGAVALAPMASAQEDPPPAPSFGSSLPEATDLVVSLGTTCVAKDAKLPDGDKVVALVATVKNVGAATASDVSVNYAAFPLPNGAVTVDKIEVDKDSVVTIPTADVGWVSRPTGAAVFSPQLDANYADNIAVEFLTQDCAPAPIVETEG